MSIGVNAHRSVYSLDSQTILARTAPRAYSQVAVSIFQLHFGAYDVLDQLLTRAPSHVSDWCTWSNSAHVRDGPRSMHLWSLAFEFPRTACAWLHVSIRTERPLRFVPYWVQPRTRCVVLSPQVPTAIWSASQHDTLPYSKVEPLLPAAGPTSCHCPERLVLMHLLPVDC